MGYDKETYTDEKRGEERVRMKIYNLDGEEDTEPLDYSSDSGRVKQALSEINSIGGVAVSQIKNPGGVQPILSKKKAQRIQEETNTIEAVENTLRRFKKKLMKLKDNQEDLRKRFSQTKMRKEELEENIREFEEENETYQELYRRMKARAKSAEGAVSSLRDEVRSWANRLDVTNERVDELMKNLPEIEQTAVEIGAIEEEGEIPPELKGEKKEPEETEESEE